MNYYIDSVFFKGNFYKLHKAETILLNALKNNLISNSEYKNAIEILKILTNKNRYSYLKKFMSDYKIKSGLNALNILNINPITIGANRGIKEIPDILKHI